MKEVRIKLKKLKKLFNLYNNILEENTIKSLLQFDPDWCASTLIVEHNNTVIKKHSKKA